MAENKAFKSIMKGLEESLEELLAEYRAKEEVMTTSGPRHPFPEPARWHYFYWGDVLASMLDDPNSVEEMDENCPLCGHKLLKFNFSSPRWTWNALCGREGPMTLCPDCPMQVDFSLEIMN